MMMRHSLSEGGSGGATTILTAAQGEAHNRQESADSGLGMGSNYNLGIIRLIKIFLLSTKIFFVFRFVRSIKPV